MNIRTLQDAGPWEWPKSAPVLIRRVLVDRNAAPADRVIAAGLAGDMSVISDVMADSLLTILNDETETDEIRAQAAISLGPVLEAMDLEPDPDDTPIADETLQNIFVALEKQFADTGNAKILRRRALEAAVRFPQPWQEEAIRTAYRSRDPEWMLTAVFGMRHIRGFDEAILEALKNPDPKIQYEAIEAAGTWGLDGAWSHMVRLVRNEATPKDLLLAAIGAVGSIRPAETFEVVNDLLDSSDEEIAEAAQEALDFAEMSSGGDAEDDEEEDEGEDSIN